MTQKISDAQLEACRQVPIHLIVGNAKLNRKVQILCPFHAENTASCTLFPTGGFHCFGCGANGNSIDFLVKLGATYPEAVAELHKYI